MKKFIYIARLLLLAALLSIATGNTYAMRADNTPLEQQPGYASVPLGIRYTKTHPLIIVADWAFYPYAYINDHGEPSGLQPEVIREIFSKLHVPYEIHCMEWKKAKRELISGHAHLMIDIDKDDEMYDTHYGNTVIANYDVACIHLNSTMSIRSMDLLTMEDTIHFNYKDYADKFVTERYGDSLHFVRQYLNPNDAIHALLKGKIRYYIWGKAALRSMIKKYGLEEELVLEDVDVMQGKFRFMSNDDALLRELDIRMSHLKRLDSYRLICDKWLNEVEIENEETSLFEIVAIVLFIVFIVVLVIAFIVIQRNSGTGDLKKEFRNISRMAIEMTDCQLLVVNVRNSWVHNMSSDFLPKDGISMRDFEALIHPEDITVEYNIRRDIDNGKRELEVISFRMKRYNDTTGDWRNISVYGFVKTSRRNKPLFIYLVLVDETLRLREQAQLDHILREFKHITEISDIGMIYYDTHGNFVNCNTPLLKIFCKEDPARAERYLKKTTLQNVPIILNGIILEKNMDSWFCGPIEVPELSLKMNAEVRIQSVIDENGNDYGYSISISSLDRIIELRRKEKKINQQLFSLKRDLTRYQGEMRFILRRNQMNTFRWHKGNDLLEISHDLFSFDLKLTLHQYMELVVNEEREQYSIIEQNPEEFFSKPQRFTGTFQRPGATSREWYIVNCIPEYDEAGTFIGAFGIRTNITSFMLSQERLRKETAKAQDSGKQKTMFLANMTHELRTPLNAVNGFAEILKLFSTPEEKKEYVGIMSNNCTMLISIVDNILQLSMMDTDGLQLHIKEVDFATRFKLSVQQLEKYFNNPDVKLLVDTPMPTLPLKVDYERIMQVLDALVNNASKFTKKGYVRVGYSFVEGYLMVYCRDSGCGIPRDRQKDVFERFVKLNEFQQGTGLGLSICKMIADTMKADIELYSREGQGSTFTFKLLV